MAIATGQIGVAADRKNSTATRGTLDTMVPISAPTAPFF
jgi:hypothetical protein